ncbi:hypothetical protein J2Y55_003339 [Bosea sp. BE125]|uniref:hypothetical protein n=1 Tax=Bosea sp. BE125 TaxID=2817909 RepID=UPI002858A3B7|nr:hypothetical protein [Bosea sp. BE125]MDR6872323.1 hypothetical protein [Bosea sp. BE125]
MDGRRPWMRPNELKFQISNLKLFDIVASRGLANEAMTTSTNSWDVVPPVLGPRERKQRVQPRIEANEKGGPG